MNTNGRIGLLMPEIIDSLNYEFLTGVYDRAKQLGYDVLVFTGVCNSPLDLQRYAHITGFENIYELVGKGNLDGILYPADMFCNERTKDHIYEMLSNSDIPCLVVGENHPDFPSMFTSQRESMKMLTMHLIEAHGYHDLYYIGGVPGHFDSNERFAGFLDAVAQAGLDWDESRMIDGYFWKDEPRRLAQRIAAGELHKPQAVVCASDVMATAFCDALALHGIRVPEQIAVTGYDGSWESYAHTPCITTIGGRYEQNGEEAVDRMHRMLGGTTAEAATVRQRICYGTSCGCAGCCKDEGTLGRYIQHRIDRTIEQKRYIAENRMHQMENVATLTQFIEKADALGYILPGWEWMDLCLCQDWLLDFADPETYRRHGFSDTMYLALSKRYGYHEQDGMEFSTAELLPSLNQPHTPKLVIFTSLHSDGQVFGYAATAYEDAHAVFVDEHYVNWLDTISNGLRSLEQKLYQDYSKKRTEQLSILDPATGLYNRRGFLASMPQFMEDAIAAEKTPLLLLLTDREQEGASMKTGIDNALLIASALRLSAGKNELYARLDDHVFAVLLHAEQKEDGKRTVENRILAIQQKMQYMQGSSMRLPELIKDHCIVDEHARADQLLEKLYLRIMGKNRAMEVSDFQEYETLLQKLRREIYLAPQEDWSISAIVSRLCISRSHFNRLYKKQFNVSCVEDIINARMERAKQLLTYTALQVQEIAEQCGYANVSHFMRQFKERFGITPTKFRKACA